MKRDRKAGFASGREGGEEMTRKRPEKEKWSVSSAKSAVSRLTCFSLFFSIVSSLLAFFACRCSDFAVN